MAVTIFRCDNASLQEVVSVRPSVRPSHVIFERRKTFFTMTTKFDMGQETVRDNSEMTSKCRSVGLSFHPTKENEQKVPTRYSHLMNPAVLVSYTQDLARTQKEYGMTNQEI